MREFISPVVLLCCLYLVNANSLKLGAENVLSRNVTTWKIVAREVFVDTYDLSWCGSEENIQCRSKSGNKTKSKRVAVETVRTELYCKPGFYASYPSCENNCELELDVLKSSCYKPSCCQNGGQCHVVNDTNVLCNCTSGWIGKYCSKPCPTNFYGPGCQLQCPICSNGGTCNPVTGKCDCSPGWKGTTCDDKCNATTYGKDCALQCDSACNGECHHVTGECQCRVGTGGSDCDFTCKDGENVQCGWFPNCCLNGATCDVTEKHSRCSCPAGYKGKYCETRCHNWGPGCFRTCLCANGGTCHPETGECNCSPGWVGPNCQNPANSTETPVCPGHCSLGCDEDGRCIFPTDETWQKDTLTRKPVPENIQIFRTDPAKEAYLHGQTDYQKQRSRLSVVSICLITVCAVLAVFVVIALVCSIKNKSNELAPWLVENDARKERRCRNPSAALPRPPSPKTQDNQYLVNSRLDPRVGHEDNIHSGTHQQPNEEETYSTVSDDLIKSKFRPLPSVTENTTEPQSPSADVILPFEKIALSRESSVSSSHPGLQRQYSNISTYEDSIRPLLRSTSVVSNTESFYEDMTRSSRTASLCRPSEISNVD